MTVGPPLAHDPGCPYCSHSHHWLDCDLCPCLRHDRPGGD